MKKISILFSIFSFLLLALPQSVSAVCPVCTVAVIGGLGLSRWLGIDDVISGLWIGGMILSSSLWFADWLYKQSNFISKFKITKTWLNTISIVLIYMLVLLPLAYTNVLGHPLNKIFGIDKLIFGTFFGSLGFLGGIWLDKKVRQIKGKQLFNYQKVIFPVGVLLIFSFIIYFVAK